LTACATASPGCPVYQGFHNTKNVIGQGRDAVTLITQKLLFLPLLENPGELGAFALEACFLGDPLKAFVP
jgi:hypothetical protein